jgi:hypothetical protein
MNEFTMSRSYMEVNMSTHHLKIFLPIAFTLLLVPATAAGDDIGAVDFRVDCAESVRADFDRALGLMHHMMYEQSRRQFEAVAEADPDCAMALWGVATTLFQPLWGTRPSPQDLQRGWELIRQAQARVDSDRERRLIDASAGFFRDPATAEFGTRIGRWIDGIADAYAQHQDDPDTAALYALSRLTLAARAPEHRDVLLTEAEQVLRAIHERHPEHPGAVHYTIHATDADGRAANALDIVETYSRIAPEVAHALHMPSHIYVRLGDWPAVIEWNERSAEAALEHRVNGTVSHHHIHALDYILYARLQQGEDDKARALLARIDAHGRHQGSLISAFHHAAMPARIAVERRQWDEAARITARSPAWLPWDQARWAEGMSWYARGLGSIHRGDTAAAREAEQHLATLRDRAEAEGDQGFATYLEIDRRILAGRIAHHDGDDRKAIELMRSAAELEAGIEKHPVTPGALLPPFEALGDLLMELERPAEALEAYRASDAVWPGRYHTVLGAARAARAAGDEDGAGTYYAQLLEIAGGSERDGVAEARRFIEDRIAVLEKEIIPRIA